MDYLEQVLATPINANIEGHMAPAEGARQEGGPGLLQGSDVIVPRTPHSLLRGGGRAEVPADAPHAIAGAGLLDMGSATAEGTRGGHILTSMSYNPASNSPRAVR